MKSFNFACFFIFSSIVAGAQEKLGITNSNYSSTNSIFLNPSSSVDSKTYMQFNLVGLNVYGMTNLAYIPDFSVWSYAKTQQIADYEVSQLKLKKFALGVASVEGPAFVMSKGNYGGGIFFRGRSVGEIKRVPYELVNLVLSPDTNTAKDYFSDLNLRNVIFNSMSWVEGGVNFGAMVKKHKMSLWTFGGNLRYIMGVKINYGRLQQLKTTIEPDKMEVEKLKGQLRYNDGGFNSGRGVGMDLGFTYKKMLEVVERYYANSTQSGCKHIDYQYKIGVSLRDLGFIRFKKNTTTADINTSGTFKIDTATRKVDLRGGLTDNFAIEEKHNPILAALPTALSVQVDWNFGNNFYVNGTVVKNIVPNAFVGVQGSNLVSICPRYEVKQFEVAMPLTLQKFIYPQLGLAFRIRTFVLGFDNVFPLIFKKKTYGLNVYMNIGFSRFRNRACDQKVRRVDDCGPKEYRKKKRQAKKLSPPKKRDFSKPRKIRK
jgi:hypothetical protein